MTHYHANTRNMDTANDAVALAPVYATKDDAKQAVLVAVGQWVGTHTYRRVTEATAWDAPLYHVEAYQSSTGERRSWSAWGCTCKQGDADLHAAKGDEDEADDTLGPCGCTDYHMADCPTRTGGTGYTMADLLERGGDLLDDDYR